MAEKDQGFYLAWKRARVKMKHLMGDKTRAGLQVPNLKLYQDAICLVWITDWVVPTNKKLLNL